MAEVDVNAVERGIVKCYYPIKGFGFIQRQRGKDVFFFRADAKSEAILLEGAAVTFHVRQEARGPRAYEIERVG
jgi:CspA family cold shock protein